MPQNAHWAQQQLRIYTMQSNNKVVTLDTVPQEWGLGVIFAPTLKFIRQSSTCAAKANKILGMVR